ncbi:MAG: hypothetical protein PHR51_02665 [Patescibacteria group bacterium]|nr:hypothetical protein [Patescibacteria group bacterium]
MTTQEWLGLLGKYKTESYALWGLITQQALAAAETFSDYASLHERGAITFLTLVEKAQTLDDLKQVVRLIRHGYGQIPGSTLGALIHKIEASATDFDSTLAACEIICDYVWHEWEQAQEGEKEKLPTLLTETRIRLEALLVALAETPVQCYQLLGQSIYSIYSCDTPQGLILLARLKHGLTSLDVCLEICRTCSADDCPRDRGPHADLLLLTLDEYAGASFSNWLKVHATAAARHAYGFVTKHAHAQLFECASTVEESLVAEQCNKYGLLGLGQEDCEKHKLRGERVLSVASGFAQTLKVCKVYPSLEGLTKLKGYARRFEQWLQVYKLNASGLKDPGIHQHSRKRLVELAATPEECMTAAQLISNDNTGLRTVLMSTMEQLEFTTEQLLTLCGRRSPYNTFDRSWTYDFAFNRLRQLVAKGELQL